MRMGMRKLLEAREHVGNACTEWKGKTGDAKQQIATLHFISAESTAVFGCENRPENISPYPW